MNTYFKQLFVVICAFFLMGGLTATWSMPLDNGANNILMNDSDGGKKKGKKGSDGEEEPDCEE